MCHWSIYASILRFAETCRASEHPEFILLLRSNVERIEEFIVRNSEMTIEDLKRWDRRRTVIDEQLCFPDGEMAEFYSALKSREGMLEAQVTYLLGVDRSPSWNPCL